MKSYKIKSEFDGLMLEAAIAQPKGTPKAIIAISHGMCEHKERYFDFMEFLADAGYICVIHDHRGHGGSVESPEDYGYFYTEDIAGIVGDLHQVIAAAKAEHPELPVYLFSHSMGTLVARCYIKKYDAEIEKLVLCGPPTRLAAAKSGLIAAKIMNPFVKKKKANLLLTLMAFGSYAKKFPEGESWLSANQENADAYGADPMCNFFFTTNGYINLAKMQIAAFENKDWNVQNPELPILMIAGSEDPVIQSRKLFKDLVDFLKETGYGNVYHKLYPGLRHELLNEKENLMIYKDVLKFFGK